MTRPDLQLQFRPGAGPLYDDTDDGGLDLPGEPLAWASTPDHASFTTTGIDIRVGLVLDDWFEADVVLAGQYDTATGRAWRLSLLGSTGEGVLRLQWSANGTTFLSEDSTLPAGPASGLAVRATLNPNNGSSQHVVTFYTAPSKAGPYSTLGAVHTTAGVTSIFNSSAALGVGSYNDGVPAGSFRPLRGRVEWMELRDFAGTVVEDVDFRGLAAGTVAVTSALGHMWSVHGTADIGEGRDFPWVDLTDRLYDGEWGYGRDNELDQFTAGTGTAVLRNDDRALDPDHAGGPWSGLLEPRTPFRYRTSDGLGGWDDAFYGFVEGSFEQTYTPPAGSTCTVNLVDFLKILEGEILPSDVYAAEVLADHPAAWWRADSADGNEMTDSSGNNRHGTWGEVEIVDPLVAGDGRAARFEHVGDWRGQAVRDMFTSPYPISIECWVRAEDLPAEFRVLVGRAKDFTGNVTGLVIGDAAGGSPNGEAQWYDSFRFHGTTKVDDGAVHHIVMTAQSNDGLQHTLWVDGELDPIVVLSGTTGGLELTERIWTIGNNVDSGTGDFGVTGVMDEVAIYPTALSGARIAAHYQAGSTAYAGELSGAAVDRVLDLVGVPAAMSDIDPGDTTVGPADYASASAAAYLTAIAESEQGAFYVDHHAGGIVVFRGRYHRLTTTRSTTVQWEFSDEDDPTALHVEPDIDVQAYGADGLINVASVSWAGGTAVTRDDASVRRYGPQSRSFTTQAPTEAAAVGVGQWAINRYARPQTRVKGWTLAPDADDRLWPSVLDLRPSTRVSLRRHPQEIGTPVTTDLYIEGVRHHVGGADGLTWRTTLQTSHADAADAAWIWGVSAWDQTTKWG